MTSEQFVIWLKGFTEACNDFTATPKQWDRIKEVLEDVEDYDDNPGLDVELEDWKDWHPDTTLKYAPSGSFAVNGSTGLGTINTSGTTVWNDKMGCWHFTNYHEGFGYYTNSTADTKKEKQQLND